MNAAQKAWATMRAKGYIKGKKPEGPPPKKAKMKLPPQAPIKMPVKVQPATSAEMMSRTVVLVLTINSTGNRRKVDPGRLDVNSSQQWINVTKKLMEAEELDEITTRNGKTKQFVQSRALPSTIKKGVYLLPVDFIEEVDARLKEDQDNLKPLVNKMIGKLDAIRAEAKDRLSHVKVGKEVRNLWDESQFPTADDLRSAFRLTWRYVFVDSAKNLEQISKELYDEERKKAEASWAETRETIQQLLLSNLSDMVNHMVDRLTPEEDGKKKIFHESAIPKMQDFLATFDARNITNDLQMKVLVDQAKNLIKGTDADDLRTNEELREYVKHGFGTIKLLLDPMIQLKPSRRITFADDE